MSKNSITEKNVSNSFGKMKDSLAATGAFFLFETRAGGLLALV